MSESGVGGGDWTVSRSPIAPLLAVVCDFVVVPVPDVVAVPEERPVPPELVVSYGGGTSFSPSAPGRATNFAVGVFSISESFAPPVTCEASRRTSGNDTGFIRGLRLSMIFAISALLRASAAWSCRSVRI